MKKLVIILLATINPVFAQPQYKVLPTDTVKLIELDELIFTKLNEYRVSYNIVKFKAFDRAHLREVSYVLTDLNTARPSIKFDHTRDPALAFNGYSGECIYLFELQSSSSNLTDTILTSVDLAELASITAQAWINSPNHNWIVTAPIAKRVAITSTITICNQKIRLVVSYHDLIETLGKPNNLK